MLRNAVKPCAIAALALGLAGAFASAADSRTGPPEPARSDAVSAPRGTLRRGPRADWELSFPDDISVVEYARRLDYFGIEIAAVSTQGKVEYIARAGQPKPVKRVGMLADDPRLYLGWKTGELVAADRKLLAKAHIHTQGKELWHFFPAATQQRMAEAERAHAQRNPQEIRRTRFEIRPGQAEGSYQFVVIDQALVDHREDFPSAPSDVPTDKR